MVLIRQACQVSDAIRPVDGDQRVTVTGFEPKNTVFNQKTVNSAQKIAIGCEKR